MENQKKKPTFFEHLYKVCSVILTMILLQGLWIIFTLIGLVLFGVMPASVAVSNVCRVRFMEGKEERLFPLFWNAYKKSFLKANGYGAILFVLLIGLSFNLRVIPFMPNVLGASFQAGAYLMIFFLLLLVMYGIPLLSNRKGTFQLVKASVLLGLCRPMETLLMIAGTFLIYYLYLVIPSIIALFGAVPVLWIFTRLANRAWKQAEAVAMTA